MNQDDWNKKIRDLDKKAKIFFSCLCLIAACAIALIVCDVVLWETKICIVIGSIGSAVSAGGIIWTALSKFLKK